MVSLVFLNLFIAIILEGFAASATESKIRIGDDCIDAFSKAWCNYDPMALGIIDIDDLEQLILDLILEEIEYKKKHDTLSVNFNLHKFKALEMYTKWKRDLITEEDFKNDEFFNDWHRNGVNQRILQREVRRFIAALQIPLYFGMKKV